MLDGAAGCTQRDDECPGVGRRGLSWRAPSMGCAGHCEVCEVWSIPTVLENAQPCAQPCFPPVFLLLSRNAFGRSAVPWLGEGPALWGTVPGVPGGQGVIDPGRLDGPGEVCESLMQLGEFLERQIPAWRGCGCPRLGSWGPWIGMHQGFPFALPFPGVFSWFGQRLAAESGESCSQRGMQRGSHVWQLLCPPFRTWPRILNPSPVTLGPGWGHFSSTERPRGPRCLRRAPVSRPAQPSQT